MHWMLRCLLSQCIRETRFHMAIYTIRTTSGREDMVVDMLSLNVRNQGLDVKAILHPAELKGYIFAEGNLADIHKAAQGMMHIRSFIEKPINLSDIQRFLEAKKVAVDVGDEVEIVGGAFKGDKGVITRLDKTKDEVTIELREGAIPIPMTISVDMVKLLKKGARPDAQPAEEGKKEKRKFSFEDLKKDFVASEDKPAEEKKEG